PEQPAGAAQRGEDRRGAGAGEPAGRLREQPRGQPDLAPVAGGDPRGHGADTRSSSGRRARPTSGSIRLAPALKARIATTYAGGTIRCAQWASRMSKEV